MLVLLLLPVGGCSASLRMQRQSNVYFERCHAADFDPSVRIGRKRACWAKWLEHYTIGQPPDRVRYARHRMHALERGELVEPLPGLHSVTVSHTAAFLTSSPESEPAPAGDSAAEDAADAEQPRSTTEKSSGADGTDPPQAEAEEAQSDPPQPPAAPPSGEQEKQTLPAPPDADGSPCGPVCDPDWRQCAVRCNDRPNSCLEACRSEYRTCMAACF